MKTQTKHTPAPWFVAQNHSDKRITNVENEKSNWSLTIYCQDEVQIEEHQANAQLIAAAPELLEALELAISKDMLSGETRDKAVAAILKARGE